MKRLHEILLINFCVAIAFVFGCATAPEVKTYLLDTAVAPPSAAQVEGAKILLVNTPTAQPGYDTADIAYSRAPLAVEYYTQSQWADTPARMLAPLVVQALETTGAFKAVVTPPTPALDDVRLDLDIIRLQQDFLSQPSQAQLLVRARLFDVNRGQVLATQLFETSAPAPSEDAYGGVQAANAAVEQFLAQLSGFVVEYAYAED